MFTYPHSEPGSRPSVEPALRLEAHPAAFFKGLGARASSSDSISSSSDHSVSAAISDADNRLNTIYRQLRRSLSPAERSSLRDEERAWIEQKEKLPNGSEELLQMIKDRTAELERRLSN
jgi:uncharacterized protein YecT (DUF1311 family)